MAEARELRDFLEWRPPELKVYIEKGILYERNKMLIYGKYKSFKSMLIQNLSLALIRGDKWIGFRTKPGGVSVLYLQLEIPEPLLHKRFKQMTNGNQGAKKEMWIWTEHHLKVDLREGMVRIREQLALHKPDVLIIDPLYKILSVDMSNNHAVTYVLDELDKLIAEYGVSIVLVTHSTKADVDGDKWGTDNMMGGALLSAWADTVMEVARDKNGLRISLDVVRHADTELPDVLVKMDKDLRFHEVTVPM